MVAWASSSLPLTPQPPLSQGKTGPGSAPVPISLGTASPLPSLAGGPVQLTHPAADQPCPLVLLAPFQGGLARQMGWQKVAPNPSEKGPPKDTEPQSPWCQHHHGHDSAHRHGAGGAWGLAETHVPPC